MLLPINQREGELQASLTVSRMKEDIRNLLDWQLSNEFFRSKFQEVARGSDLPAHLRKLANEIEANQ